ncbi:CcdB family protein [Ewingella americana]|uniref:CcdB family protein n=1 Tax=Ewingella americana TaxID=41202 RepID=UPI0016398E57|nr:CcdB family protein [Ewingella americana]QMV52073.1 plasmid maintenance protein CcdB [Ewingella americana]
MAQFDIYENLGAGKGKYPFFMDIQNPLFERLNERVVIPLTSINNLKAIKRLHPSIEISGQHYLVMTNLLTSISMQELRHQPVINAGTVRDEVVAAMDLLVLGI